VAVSEPRETLPAGQGEQRAAEGAAQPARGKADPGGDEPEEAASERERSSGEPPLAADEPGLESVECAPGVARLIDAVPSLPGVYLLKERGGRVIYVGKAKNLRSRVSSYFRGGDGRHQVAFLVRRVADLECLVTQNEKEALILENNLIKQYKPRYNIRLKDDKSYVSVKITAADA
jgi:excinuclease ABC subunit C